MNSAIQVFLFSCLIGTSSSIKSQEICSSFCITNIEMDSLLPNVMNLTIYFEGDENDFINYPYVATVMDLNWDTVGTGMLNFFGQIGNSSQTYQVNTVFDALPANFSAYADFVFDTISCLLYYTPGNPCSTTGVDNGGAFTGLKLYPNPFTTATIIESDEPFEELSLTLYNAQGRLVKTMENISGDNIKLEREGLSEGLYFLQLQDRRHTEVTTVIIID